MTGTGAPHPKQLRVMLLGATGTIGRATARALHNDGHDVVCLVRPGAPALPDGVVTRVGQVTDQKSLRQDGFRGEAFDVLVSCLASRSGDSTPYSHRVSYTISSTGKYIYTIGEKV